MSLYPVVTLDPSVASQDPNLIASGTLIVIPIDMTTVQMTQIALQHMSATQDFSLRAWISVYQDGIALPPGIYPILKFMGQPIVLYVSGQTPPTNTFAVAVDSGLYYLNILNLTNEQNYFGFTKTDLA